MSGGIPPFELIDALYATPTNPCGREVVTMEMGCAGAMVILNNSVSVAGGVALSATCTVNCDVPEPLGVPAISPLFPGSIQQAGSRCDGKNQRRDATRHNQLLAVGNAILAAGKGHGGEHHRRRLD